MTQIAVTERLSIREFNSQDTSSLSPILLSQEVMKYSFRRIHSEKDIESYIENCICNYKKYGFGQWAVIDKMNAQLIGICGLNSGFNGDTAIIHVNYRFAKKYWGRGFASEALQSVLNYTKNVLKLEMVYALVESNNDKSIRLADNHGFRFEKETIYKERKLMFYKKFI